jgi:hypothetical protein
VETFMHVFFGTLFIGFLLFLVGVILSGCGKTIIAWPYCFEGTTEEERQESCVGHWKWREGYDSSRVKKKLPRTREDSLRGIDHKYEVRLFRKTREAYE